MLYQWLSYYKLQLCMLTKSLVKKSHCYDSNYTPENDKSYLANVKDCNPCERVGKPINSKTFLNIHEWSFLE